MSNECIKDGCTKPTVTPERGKLVAYPQSKAANWMCKKHAEEEIAKKK